MAREIIINDRNLGTRIAILEDRELEDMLFARDFSQQIVGNVYKGRVEDVVPGIQAAFVNIGRRKNVFLPVNGVVPNGTDKKIEHVLQPGQEVVIQIRKEATGSKGPKGSCKLELPGRYLIFLDEPGHIGVSRKLPGNERGRLRELAQEIIPSAKGAILRTEAENKNEAIKQEVNSLLALRQKIADKAKQVKSPALIHHHSDLIDQMLRDRFTAEVDKLVVDTETGYEQILDFVQTVVPHLKEKVEYYQHPKSIFAHYGVDKQLEKLLESEVELDCGGYLVIDTTEALTAIDVNTGTYTEDNIEDTVAQTNLEAAEIIPRQLRLRNISGIIVIDFIGMDSEETKDQVLSVLEEGLEKDKTRTSLLGMTQLGLVQITRKRKKNSIDQLLKADCPCCSGSGKVLSKQALAWSVIDKIRETVWDQSVSAVVVELNSELAAYLMQVGRENLLSLQEELEIEIQLQVNPKLHRTNLNLELSQEKIRPPFSVGSTKQVEIKDSFKESSGLTWLDGWLVEIEGGKRLIDQVVEIKIKAVDSLISKAEIAS